MVTSEQDASARVVRINLALGGHATYRIQVHRSSSALNDGHIASRNEMSAADFHNKQWMEPRMSIQYRTCHAGMCWCKFTEKSFVCLARNAMQSSKKRSNRHRVVVRTNTHPLMIRPYPSILPQSCRCRRGESLNTGSSGRYLLVSIAFGGIPDPGPCNLSSFWTESTSTRLETRVEGSPFISGSILWTLELLYVYPV